MAFYLCFPVPTLKHIQAVVCPFPILLPPQKKSPPHLWWASLHPPDPPASPLPTATPSSIQKPSDLCYWLGGWRGEVFDPKAPILLLPVLCPHSPPRLPRSLSSLQPARSPGLCLQPNITDTNRSLSTWALSSISPSFLDPSHPGHHCLLPLLCRWHSGAWALLSHSPRALRADDTKTASPAGPLSEAPMCPPHGARVQNQTRLPVQSAQSCPSSPGSPSRSPAPRDPPAQARNPAVEHGPCFQACLLH